MSEYPDYVPSRFAMGRLRRWGARDPRRVIAWFAGMSLVVVCFLIVGAITDSTPMLISGGVAMVDLTVEGAIFGPRAWRAAYRRPAAPS